MKKFAISFLCLTAAGALFAQEGGKKLETIPWSDVGRIYQEREKGKDAAATREPAIAWKAGDRWTVDVFGKKTAEKTAAAKWVPIPKTLEYEVLGSEVKDGEEIVRIAVVLAGEADSKLVLKVNAISRAVVGATRGDRELAAGALEFPGVWDLPGAKAQGKVIESPLGVPRDAVIFSEGVVGFPATEIPKSAGKVCDVEFKNAAGDDCFQRWDDSIPQFPLCSFTLDRVTLLRAVSAK